MQCHRYATTRGTSSGGDVVRRPPKEVPRANNGRGASTACPEEWRPKNKCFLQERPFKHRRSYIWFVHSWLSWRGRVRYQTIIHSYLLSHLFNTYGTKSPLTVTLHLFIYFCDILNKPHPLLTPVENHQQAYQNWNLRALNLQTLLPSTRIPTRKSHCQFSFIQTIKNFIRVYYACLIHCLLFLSYIIPTRHKRLRKDKSQTETQTKYGGQGRGKKDRKDSGCAGYVLVEMKEREK